jgi:hypothetical protein
MAVDKEKVRALAKRAETIARASWRDFRENSVYLQLKVGLAISYGVLVVTTCALAPPAAPSSEVRLSTIPWGVADRTGVELQNYSLGTLSGHVVELHGSVLEFDGKTRSGPWRGPLPRLGEGAFVTIWPEMVFDDAGKPADNGLTLTRVRVYPEDRPERLVIDAVPKKDPR